MLSITKTPMITSDEIHNAIDKIAMAINRDYQAREPILIGVLNGVFILFADLVRKLDIKHQVDFVKVSSYGDEETPHGLTWHLYPTIEISDRDVIIVDDIIDTGATATCIGSYLFLHNARSIQYCALLSKRARRKYEIPSPYIGIEIDDYFVYGYGLDREGYDRNLKDIYAES